MYIQRYEKSTRKVTKSAKKCNKKMKKVPKSAQKCEKAGFYIIGSTICIRQEKVFVYIESYFG